MEDTEFHQALLKKFGQLDTAIAWHEEQLSKLRGLKAAFKVIHDSESSVIAENLVSDLLGEGHSLVAKQIQESETVPLSDTAEALYGDMARKLRKFIVQGTERSRTRKEIVDAAKDMDASSNFPYRFLKRMLDTGELIEVSRGQYIATPKMLKKFEDGQIWSVPSSIR